MSGPLSLCMSVGGCIGALFGVSTGSGAGSATKTIGRRCKKTNRKKKGIGTTSTHASPDIHHLSLLHRLSFDQPAS